MNCKEKTSSYTENKTENNHGKSQSQHDKTSQSLNVSVSKNSLKGSCASQQIDGKNT